MASLDTWKTATRFRRDRDKFELNTCYWLHTSHNCQNKVCNHCNTDTFSTKNLLCLSHVSVFVINKNPCRGGGGVDLKKWNRAGGWMTGSAASSYKPPPSFPSQPACLSVRWTAEKKKFDPVSRYRKGVWSYQAHSYWKLLWKYDKTAGLWVLTWKR